jgi:hypothetical protein
MEPDNLSDQQDALLKKLEHYLSQTHDEAEKTQTTNIKEKLDKVEVLLKELVRNIKKS